jgi:hypothetical protein
MFDMKLSVFVIILMCCGEVYSQPFDLAKKRKEIESEGKKLYRSEMASWYGTDIFIKELERKLPVHNGYFSYEDSLGEKCVFFSLKQPVRVIATITFDSTLSMKTAKRDTTLRAFTAEEQVLYDIRTKALDISNNDSLFETFAHTSLNLIPIVEGKSRKVYFLTGPESEGLVLFGNDYLLLFDEDNNLVGKHKLHKTLISVEFDKTVQGFSREVSSSHTHLPGTDEFMTPTDVCTLMLYRRFTPWKLHYVFGKSYVSIWNCETNQLVLMSNEDWGKMNKRIEKASLR